jgi:hypothetical protein
MNIVGENFPREIVKQIEVRQKKKGAKNRNPEGNPSLLVWQNANTGWVKMVSSVNIDLNDRRKVSNKEMDSILLPREQLAQEYVLFGGTYYQEENKDGLSRGIARNKSIRNHAAYGLGGLDLGLRPMPGITSFSIKSENRGSLRTATIGIKCYNRHQFDIINTLYLSLGYSVLIEWGNVMYYDNSGGSNDFQKENTHSLADEFLKGSLKWNSILDNIQKERLKSCGNYDASLGKVVNFRWTLNKDLSYDITVTVRSVGDVIESLKMNALSGYIYPIQPLSVSQQLTSAFVQSGSKDFNRFILNKYAIVKQVYNLLLQNGLDDIKARGVLANIYSESTFNPGIEVTDTNGLRSGGLFQWNGPRLTAMKAKVGTNWKTNVQGQVNYVFQEQGTKIQEYKSSRFNTAGDAAYWWAEFWEVTAKAHWNQRKANASLFPPGLNFSANTIPSVDTTPTTTAASTSTPQLPYASPSKPSIPFLPTAVVPLQNTAPAQTTQLPYAPPTDPLNPNNSFINTITGDTGGISPTPPTDNTTVEIIDKYAYTHDIGALFYNTRIKLDSNPTLTNGSNVDAVKISFDNNGVTTPQYYVRLGYFLQQLEENIIYQLKNSDKKNPSKIIKFDYDINSNIILLYNRQLSANPNACIFKRKLPLSDGTDITLFPELNDFLLEGSGTTYSSIYGKIMNIYFSMGHILDQMDRLKNADTGVLTLIDLLKILTRTFCDSTGNYNKIEPTVDYETNIIKFIDDVKLPDFSAIISKLSGSNQSNVTAKFDMFGYYATPNSNISEAGIVRDLSLTTTISPNLATMLTIGAQANGYITGQDSTALSVMNYGLIDRVKEEWVEPLSVINYPSPPSVSTPPPTPPTLSPLQPQTSFVNFITGTQQAPTQTQTSQTPNSTQPPTLEIKYKDVIESFNRFIQEMSENKWNQGDINAFSNSIQSFAEYNQAEETLKQRQSNPLTSSPNIGFLPFDLTLTIDGLSGMKIYQKFVADTEFLPSNYPQSLEFLIKGITHEIKDNQWVTTLESLAVPRNPFGAKDKFNIGARTSGQSSPTERAAGAGGSRPTGFSTGGGGTSRTIEGKTYKNGQMEGALRPINNQAKYKGAISSDGGRIRLYTKASLALDQLIVAAEQAGITVKINSGYRTYDDQVRVKAQFGRQAATPGRSNHGFGLAVDFATSGLSRIKPGDKLYDWLAAGNGAKYGFKRIASESWHWEYQI